MSKYISVSKIQRLKNKYLSSKMKLLASSETDADPFKLLTVDPNDIVHTTGPKTSDISDSHLDFNKSFTPQGRNFGSVRNGKWDKNNGNFSDMALFKSLKNRYVEAYDWEETEFYQKHTERIKKRGHSFGCDSVDELGDRLHKTDELYNSIKSRGYKTQKELGRPIHKEIIINIGRNGELLFNGGGRHRLSIAKILNLETVPVLVLVRHEKWQMIREKIRNENGERSTDSHMNHPDLKDLINN